MITIYQEQGYLIRLDRNTLIVTDEGYGTVEKFDYSDTLFQELVREHKTLLRECGE